MWTVCKIFFKHFEKHSKNIILIVLLKTFLKCFFVTFVQRLNVRITTFLQHFKNVLLISYQ